MDSPNKSLAPRRCTESNVTPPVIYSESNRAKLVYLIEAHPSAEHAILLKPGQPVDVRRIPNRGST